MRDGYNRDINYLRLSVTDRCNLRCRYCLPKEGLSLMGREDILAYEELLKIVAAAVETGISKIRITGGEPLVRKGIIEFISHLREIEGIKDISLTTNGILLASFAEAIYRAGIKRINISLDSLRKEKYRRITGGGDLDAVLEGIEEARRLGFSPIKINAVVVKGFNDDEILDFAGLAVSEPFQVRFIELMPLGEKTATDNGNYLSNEIVHKTITGKYLLEPLARDDAGTDGPARIYKISGGRGEIGFISPLSHNFCHLCNRLRLTSQGRLLSCLLYPEEIDLKGPLRAGCTGEELAFLIRRAVMVKPVKHQISCDRADLKKCRREMSKIGG